MNFNIDLLQAVLDTYNIFYDIDIDDGIIISTNKKNVEIKFKPNYEKKMLEILVLDNAKDE